MTTCVKQLLLLLAGRVKAKNVEKLFARKVVFGALLDKILTIFHDVCKLVHVHNLHCSNGSSVVRVLRHIAACCSENEATVQYGAARDARIRCERNFRKLVLYAVKIQ